MATVRDGGYASLNAYGALGDCRAAALVAVDGAVDWLAAPRIDDPPLCAAMLDPDGGGSFTLSPGEPFECSQRYVPDTMALETTFVCQSGTVRVTDTLNRGVAGPLSWTELARRVEADSGQVRMRWEVHPGHRLGTSRPWTRWRGEVPVLRSGRTQLAVISHGAGRPSLHPQSVSGEFTVRAGESVLLGLVVNDSEPVPTPRPDAIAVRLENTLDFWRRWCRGIAYDGPHRDEVVRSALVLKSLTMSASHGIASAPTTSLPEWPGKSRNFDYRFGWVRDASFSLDAMSRLGLREEVHGSLCWLLTAVGTTAPHLRAMYTLDGEPAPSEMDSMQRLPGYRDSPPVQAGNSAAGQLQLGAFGDLMDAVWRYSREGGFLDEEHSTMLARMVDHACDLWRGQDSGIWELGDQEHYTISKLGCWVALDRAVRLAEAGHMPTGHLHSWQQERDAVRAFVDEHCWSEAKQSYTFYAGTDKLDASVLLAARTGFLDPDDPRLASTIEAIRADLSADGALLYRYSGMEEEEGAFLACSFWLVEALAISGERDQAARLFEQLLGYPGDTGLLSEEIDPKTGELLGNLPLGLSHLALIGAASTLAEKG
jgi:GH15 family glucan-1,4-alpha-glucosidase